jgi:hypothetical protein
MTEQAGAVTTREQIQAGSILYRVSWFNEGPRAMAMQVARVHPGGCGYYITKGTGPMRGYEVERQDQQGNALIHSDCYFTAREALVAALSDRQLKAGSLQRELRDCQAQIAALQAVIAAYDIDDAAKQSEDERL